MFELRRRSGASSRRCARHADVPADRRRPHLDRGRERAPRAWRLCLDRPAPPARAAWLRDERLFLARVVDQASLRAPRRDQRGDRQLGGETLARLIAVLGDGDATRLSAALCVRPESAARLSEEAGRRARAPVRVRSVTLRSRRPSASVTSASSWSTGNNSRSRRDATRARCSARRRPCRRQRHAGERASGFRSNSNG